MLQIKSYLDEQRKVVEEALDLYMLKASGPFSQHIEAMRYSLMAGGKRVRPILCLAAGQIIDDSPTTRDNLLPVACALEYIHTYSLIHDDLPAMDDDSLRRGKPTNHILFGEAEAILAGDGLLSWAFDILSNPEYGSMSAQRRLKITHIIARASGSLGMVGGQSLDIANENHDYPFEMLRTIHSSKTGALITCALQAGAIGAGASTEEENALITYGNYVGLAFQIIDDLLNITGTTEQLGKTAGSDEQHGKATYPAFFGVDDTRKKAQDAVNSAKEALGIFGDNAKSLLDLADYIYHRSH